MNNSFSKVPLQTARKFCPTASECIKAEDGMCKFWDVMHHYECEIHLYHELCHAICPDLIKEPDDTEKNYFKILTK